MPGTIGIISAQNVYTRPKLYVVDSFTYKINDNGGSWQYHVWTSSLFNAITVDIFSGNFDNGRYVEFLSIGGGGGGGGASGSTGVSGGGGGAGGVVSGVVNIDNLSNFGQIDVVVGDGGTGGVNAASAGSNGGSSYLAVLSTPLADTYAYGGGGSGLGAVAGQDGGSGGGGAATNTVGTLGLGGKPITYLGSKNKSAGYRGGTGFGSGATVPGIIYRRGGGGGGAGGPGLDGASGGSTGGNGISLPETWVLPSLPYYENFGYGPSEMFSELSGGGLWPVRTFNVSYLAIGGTTATFYGSNLSANDVGAPISGFGIPDNTYVVSVSSSITLTMSNAATVNTNGSIITIGKNNLGSRCFSAGGGGGAGTGGVAGVGGSFSSGGFGGVAATAVSARGSNGLTFGSGGGGSGAGANSTGRNGASGLFMIRYRL